MSIYSEFGPAIGHCSKFTAVVKGDGTGEPSIEFNWKDPEVEGVPYGGTVLVIKEGSEPQSASDGTILVDNSEKDKYETTPFTYLFPTDIPGIKDLHAALFPYSASKAYNNLKVSKADFTIEVVEKSKRLVEKSKTLFNFGHRSNGVVRNDKYIYGSITGSYVTSLNEIDPTTGVNNILTTIDGSTLGLLNFTNFTDLGNVVEYNSDLYIAIGYKTTVSGTSHNNRICVLKYDGNTITKVVNHAPSADIRSGSDHSLIIHDGDLYLITDITYETLKTFRIQSDGTVTAVATTGWPYRDPELVIGYVSESEADGFVIYTTGSDGVIVQYKYTLDALKTNVVVSEKSRMASPGIANNNVFFKLNGELYAASSKTFHRIDLDYTNTESVSDAVSYRIDYTTSDGFNSVIVVGVDTADGQKQYISKWDLETV